MPKIKKNKHVSAINKSAAESYEEQAFEARKDTMQSGLYFYLLDFKRKIKQNAKGRAVQLDIKSSFFDNSEVNLEFVHSDTQYTARNAVYLKYTNSDLLANLFDNAVKECHISVDRDYLEFEGDGSNKKLRWHYCHYTEEYKVPVESEDGNEFDKYTVHIYFDSLGKITEQKITHNGVRTRNLEPNELKKIDFNIKYATSLVSDLIKLKFEEYTKYLHLAKENLKVALNSNGSPEDISEYKKYYELVQRFADENIIMCTPEALESRINELQQSLSLKVTERVFESSPPVVLKSELESSNEAAGIAKSNEYINEQAIKEIDMLYALIDKPILNMAKLDELAYSIVTILNLLPKKTQNRALKAVGRFLDLNYIEIFKAALSPEKVTLEFVSANIDSIEIWAEKSFYNDMVQGAIISFDEQWTVFKDICDFLHKNSHRYNNFIRETNNISYDQDNNPINPIAHDLLLICYYKHDPATFKMLLEHGVDLGANMVNPIATDRSQTGLAYIPLVKGLLEEFNKYLYDSYRVATEEEKGVNNINIFNQFLRIMLSPEFISGSGYVYNLYNKIPKSTLRSTAKSLIKLKREHNGEGVSKTNFIIDTTGTISVLDVATKKLLPDSSLKIIFKTLDINEQLLIMLAIDLGIYLMEQKCNVMISKPLSKNLEKINEFFVIANQNASTDERFMKSYSDFMKDIYLNELKGNNEALELRFIITTNKDRHKGAALYEPNNVQDMKEVIHYFLNAIYIKLKDMSYQQVEGEILDMYNKMLSIDEKSFKIAQSLGNILLLILKKPSQTQQFPKYYGLIYRSFLDLEECNYCITDFINDKSIESFMLGSTDRIAKISERFKDKIKHLNLPYKERIIDEFERIDNERATDVIRSTRSNKPR